MVCLPGEPGLSYVDRGPRDGHVVVLLHSLGTDHRLWTRELDQLAGDYRLLAPDSRGHGESEWTPGLTIDAWVADLVRLLDHAGVKRASFVGISMGGVQGLAFALAHPERVATLVLADTFAELDASTASTKIESMSGRARALGMPAYADAYVADTFTSHPVVPAADAVRDALARMRLEPYLESVHTCFGVRLAGRLDRVQAPTLVLWGENDGKAPRSLAEALAEGIAGAEIRDIPRAGHLANLENPKDFLSAIHDHLATRTAASTRSSSDG